MIKDLSIIRIAGCGNIGSFLSYFIILRSLRDESFSELHLYDSDLLHEPNLPYLFLNENEASKYMRNPKVIALGFQLCNIKPPHLSIIVHANNYPEEKLSGFCIDCRDTNEHQETFNVKLCQDGNYGRIIWNPKKEIELKHSRYELGRSSFNAILFVSDFCKMIFCNPDYNENLNNNQIIINYGRGGTKFYV